MSRETRVFHVTVPANTPKAANFTADLSFPARVVQELEVVVPAGPRGFLGFAIGAAGVPIIPVEPGAFMVTDGEVISWALQGYHDSGSWTLFAYNSGKYAHTLEVRFLVVLPGDPMAPAGGSGDSAVALPQLPLDLAAIIGPAVS